jgi:hypothetical protein
VTTENVSVFVGLVLFLGFVASTFYLRSAAFGCLGQAVWTKPILKPPVQLDGPARSRWIIIGEYYVRGKMDGEVMTFQNDNSTEEQTVELR